MNIDIMNAELNSDLFLAILGEDYIGELSAESFEQCVDTAVSHGLKVGPFTPSEIAQALLDVSLLSENLGEEYQVSQERIAQWDPENADRLYDQDGDDPIWIVCPSGTQNFRLFQGGHDVGCPSDDLVAHTNQYQPRSIVGLPGCK